MWVRFRIDHTFQIFDKVQKETGDILILCKDRGTLHRAILEVKDSNPELDYYERDKLFRTTHTSVTLYTEDDYLRYRYYLCGQYSKIYVETGAEVPLGKVLVRLRSTRKEANE